MSGNDNGHAERGSTRLTDSSINHGGFEMTLALVPSSPELLEQIERAVHARTGGSIRSLQIRIDEGCLIVSGRTSTYYNKQLATHAVRDAVDDMTVQNDVEVC